MPSTQWFSFTTTTFYFQDRHNVKKTDQPAKGPGVVGVEHSYIVTLQLSKDEILVITITQLMTKTNQLLMVRGASTNWQNLTSCYGHIPISAAIWWSMCYNIMDYYLVVYIL